MPRKRPNPFAPQDGDVTDTTGKTPRNFKASLQGNPKKKRKKASGILLGRDKGMYRKTDAGYKKRRFTFDQRQKFRAKRQAPSWGPESGRPR